MIKILRVVFCLWSVSVSAQRSVEISFENNTLQDEYTINTLRFYLSQIQFHIEGDSWVGEGNDAHLIDLENPDSWEIQLPKELAKSSIDSISFLLGVDSTNNVAGILEGDLDPINGMYWAWNSGYINFKVEGEKRSSKTSFEYHLGGYLAPHATARELRLPKSSKRKRLRIQLDLKQFLDQIDMSELKEVMIPGEEAVELSDQLSTCFSFE